MTVNGLMGPDHGPSKKICPARPGPLHTLLTKVKPAIFLAEQENNGESVEAFSLQQIQMTKQTNETDLYFAYTHLSVSHQIPSLSMAYSHLCNRPSLSSATLIRTTRTRSHRSFHALHLFISVVSSSGYLPKYRFSQESPRLAHCAWPHR